MIGAVVLSAGVGDVIVVTGGAREDVESALRGMPVCMVANPDYAKMWILLQCCRTWIRQKTIAVFGLRNLVVSMSHF